MKSRLKPTEKSLLVHFSGLLILGGGFNHRQKRLLEQNREWLIGRVIPAVVYSSQGFNPDLNTQLSGLVFQREIMTRKK